MSKVELAISTRIYIWRKVDDEGEVLDVLVPKERDTGGALKLLRRLLRNQCTTPTTITTDGLGSYAAAPRALDMQDCHRPGSLHDCRGTFATELLLAGLSDNEAADILSWETERVKDIRRKYVDDKKIAASIVERLEDARQARTKTKPEQKL